MFVVIKGWDFGGQYFAGYVVEKSLSVDNLFVFVVIMNTFAVPAIHQQKVLIVGIILALLLRVIFIALGAALLSTFSFMFLVFGLLLIATAIQLFRHRNQDPNVEDNALVRLTQKWLPVTADFHEGKLLTTVGDRRMVTPMFIVLVAIGSTDILVTGLLDRLVYLSSGLALILAFIGVKLALHWGHPQNNHVPEIPTSASLVVIAGILIVTTVASLLKVRRDPFTRAHAGSLRAPVRNRCRGTEGVGPI